MNLDILNKLFMTRNKNLLHLGAFTRPYIYDLQHTHNEPNKYWHVDSSGEVNPSDNYRVSVGRYTKIDYDIVYNYLEKTIKNHNFDELFVGFTSEGFSAVENAQIISEIMDKNNLSAEKDKVILSTGKHFSSTKSLKSHGINMMPNFGIAEYNFKAFNKYYENNKNIVIPSNERTPEKIFGAFYSRITRGRLEVFNYFVDNYLFKDSIVMFASGILQFHKKMVDMGYEDKFLSHNTYTSSVNKQAYGSNYHHNIINDLREHTRKIFTDVVVETVVYEKNVEWITEKTFIPLIVGAPMIVLTHPNFYSMLHRLGFKTFSDFWPEDFDSIIDHEKRIARFKQVLTYIREEYNTLEKRKRALHKMSSILEHNSKRMMELIKFRRREDILRPTYMDCEFYDIVYNNTSINVNEYMLNKYS